MRAAAPLVGAMLLAGCNDMAVKCCDTVAVRLMSDMCFGDATTCSIIEVEKQLEFLRLFQVSASNATERVCVVGTARAAGSPPPEAPPTVESCGPSNFDEDIARLEAELQRLRSLQGHRLN